MFSLLCLTLILGFSTDPLIVWDGDAHIIGEGWVGGQCKTATIKKQDKFIRFHTQDPKTFAEWGWQWAPWKPEFAGSDVRPFQTIVLEIRVYGPILPNDLLLSLRSPGDHHLTVNDSLKKREPKIFDQSWHRIVVQMKDLKARDEKFDPIHVVNVILGTWVEKGDFTVDLRRVEFLP